MKVSVAGMRVGSRADWGASCPKFYICRQESALAIQLSTPAMCLVSTLRSPLAAIKKGAQTKCISCAEQGRSDPTAIHQSLPWYHNGIRYTCQPNACPMPCIPWHCHTIRVASWLGLVAILGWTIIQLNKHHNLKYQRHQCTIGIDQITSQGIGKRLFHSRLRQIGATIWCQAGHDWWCASDPPSIVLSGPHSKR